MSDAAGAFSGAGLFALSAVVWALWGIKDQMKETNQLLKELVHLRRRGLD